LKSNSAGCENRDRLLITSIVCSSWVRVNASTFAFSLSTNFILPRLNALYLLRMLIALFIHHNNDEVLCDCSSTLTDSKWNWGSKIKGRYSICGLAVEKPALRPECHCMGVRTPSRSPR